MEDRALAVVGPSVEEEEAQVAAALAGEAPSLEVEEEEAQVMEDRALAVVGPSVEEEEAQVMEDRALAVVGPSVEEEEAQGMEEEEAQAVEAPCLEVATALEDGDPALAVADAVLTVEA
ncbi:hypothetical protein QYF61_014872 [Mycteria americana]|uniref:Uncharacterized protein n=1 Tax=Mycteria americana TaxID=33587 RepID=A0AAN7MML0_MYCAM|nr:hypothetical protein QYF61_014872 [Mycteria americana]